MRQSPLTLSPMGEREFAYFISLSLAGKVGADEDGYD